MLAPRKGQMLYERKGNLYLPSAEIPPGYQETSRAYRASFRSTSVSPKKREHNIEI